MEYFAIHPLTFILTKIKFPFFLFTVLLTWLPYISFINLNKYLIQSNEKVLLIIFLNYNLKMAQIKHSIYKINWKLNGKLIMLFFRFSFYSVKDIIYFSYLILYWWINKWLQENEGIFFLLFMDHVEILIIHISFSLVYSLLLIRLT